MSNNSFLGLGDVPWPVRVPEVKETRTASAILSMALGEVQWTPRDYSNFAKEGYQFNSDVYACIKQIADACKGIPWNLYRQARKLKEIEEHPILTLINRPSPRQGGSSFMESVVSYLMISGNSYIEGVGPDRRPPMELYSLRPDRMQVMLGNSANPIAGYQYNTGMSQTRFQPEEICHIKLFNPLDDWYGMSPLEAAARSVDQANEALKWNVALLQNSARPPGALVSKDELTDEQFVQLKSQIDDKYSGSRNAGKPLLLSGGLDWKSFGLTPIEMDWLNSEKATTRRICSAFGVPPEIIGDSSNRTYSNYQEARRSFYTETIIPLMSLLKDELNTWLVPKFDPSMYIDFDKDSIDALQEDRDKIWSRVNTARFLTVNEKRDALGYEPIEGGDVLDIPATAAAPQNPPVAQ